MAQENFDTLTIVCETVKFCFEKRIVGDIWNRRPAPDSSSWECFSWGMQAFVHTVFKYLDCLRMRKWQPRDSYLFETACERLLVLDILTLRAHIQDQVCSGTPSRWGWRVLTLNIWYGKKKSRSPSCLLRGNRARGKRLYQMSSRNTQQNQHGVKEGVWPQVPYTTFT